MTPEQLIEHFETGAEVARVMQVVPSSVSEWKAKGEVPIDRQCQAEIITRGKLKADRRTLFAPLRRKR